MSSLFGLDRWGRSVTDRIGSLQDLSETSIGFASVTEGLDLSTPSGRVSWIALRVHRVRTGPLRERVRAGIAAAKKTRQTLWSASYARAMSEKSSIALPRARNKRQISQRLGIVPQLGSASQSASRKRNGPRRPESRSDPSP